MEQRYNHQLQALANELQQKTQGNETVKQANQKHQEQGGHLLEENRKLQVEGRTHTPTHPHTRSSRHTYAHTYMYTGGNPVQDTAGETV